MLPPHGFVLASRTGAGRPAWPACACAWPPPRPPGAYPVAVEIRMGAEPAERLEGAVLPGWTRLEGA
jgi:hypothetical protein